MAAARRFGAALWLAGVLWRPVAGDCLNGKIAGEVCTCTFPRVLVPDATGNGQECVIEDCGHGSFNRTLDECVCEPGWRVAGITDIVNDVYDRCTQFQCRSDSDCVAKLGIPSATCPHQGWNCNCGFRMSGFTVGEAKCMRPWYVTLSYMIILFEELMLHMWKVFAVAVVVALPFGKNIVGADDMWTWRHLPDDFAWSTFAFKLGVWAYCFVIVVYMTLAAMALSVYVFLAIVALLVVLVIMAVACICAMCSGGGGSGLRDPCHHECQLDCCGDCCVANSHEGCCNLAEGCSAECWQCLCCQGSYAMSDPQALYGFNTCWYYDPYLYSSRDIEADCCGSCSGNRCGRCCMSSTLGIPCFRFLVYAFPMVPENMLGGLIGLMVGTHPMCNHYDAESPCVECLSSPCWSITNRSEMWRETVRQFLYEVDPMVAVQTVGRSVAEPHSDGSDRINFGGVSVVEDDEDSFTSDDRIFNFDDYRDNACWICQQARDEWDLWTSCGHAFCSQCSTEMLRRRMPCPFCRVRSAVVLRRGAYEPSSEDLGGRTRSG